ncbi:Pentatricopeptide repeat-containing protein, mitochondrial [Ananas comosus]|uniref:Pentatricopeptide repeat-containing protein, mitochondrial n=1 Tax=Ananas comosus TaxID=4615 RepID=A0A199VYB7_ANACO|nr:Pentatricopeptide repeat-containing protein, mitochondrial [Ananas comosus]
MVRIRKRSTTMQPTPFKKKEEKQKEKKKKPPRAPHTFLAHLKSIPSPSAAADSLLHLLGSSSSATTKPYLVDYPAVSSVLLRVARARLFPLLRSLLDALRLRRGPPLRDSLFASLIQHLGRARLPDDALRLFLSIPSFPCADKSPSTHTLNSLLHALVDNARLPEARALLARSSSQQLGLRPNAVSYNAILKGCCSCASHGAMARAREVLDEMARRGVRPSAATYNTLIGCAIRSKQLDAAVRLKEEMGRKGVSPNAVTYAILMRGLCSEGRFEAAKKMMFDMEYQGCAASAVNYGVLMSDRGRRGDVAGMTELLREMRRRGMKPDAVTYSILINYMCAKGRVGDAYKVFVEMQMKGACEPSAAMYRMLVDGCCRAGEFEMGLRISTAMSATKHRLRPESLERLIRGLCQIGKVDDACFVLEQMEKMSVGLGAEGWAALIVAVGGRNCDAVQLLHELLL